MFFKLHYLIREVKDSNVGFILWSVVFRGNNAVKIKEEIDVKKTLTLFETFKLEVIEKS